MKSARLQRIVLSVAVMLGHLLLHVSSATYADEPEERNVQVGSFDIKRTASDLVDPETLASMSDILNADTKINWQVYVPENYDPGRPAGVLVYVSPMPFGQMPNGWQPLFAEENLIFISADQSGNRVLTKRRMLFAALAPYVVAQSYEVDPGRVYVSGFSGGGKVASIAAIQFANLFTGAVYICGVEFWSKIPPALESRVMSNRYVFLTGGQDFNRDLTRKIYRRYERAGVPNIRLIDISGMGHDEPGREDFRAAIQYLDRRE
jgi:predicted esterase